MNGSPLLLDRAELDDRSEFRDAVLAGLDSKPRAIPAKFLYDARGSALFDAICELPEYYLTRTEIEILRRFEADIAAMAGPGCALVEYGSGSSVKSRLLIEAMRDLVAYVPIDISRQHLDATANGLRRDYPHLKVEPVCADYMTLARLPADVSAAAAALAREGKLREALSLLYRGALSELVHKRGVQLLPSHTEGEAVRLAQLPYFGSLVESWRSCAYAMRTPPAAEVERLASEYRAAFA